MRFIAVFVSALLLCSCSEKASITYQDKSYETPTMSVNLKIPQFSGLENDSFEAEINEEIADTCNGFLRKFEKSAEDFSYMSVFDSTTNFYSHDKIISLVTDISYYTQKPHNNSFRIAKTLNPEKSRELRLKDLFEGDAYIDHINNTLTELVKSNPDEYSGLWAKPQLCENQGFYISDKDLVIYYPPYELSYYSRGFVEFSIPLSDLSGYLDEDFKQIAESTAKPPVGSLPLT